MLPSVLRATALVAALALATPALAYEPSLLPLAQAYTPDQYPVSAQSYHTGQLAAYAPAGGPQLEHTEPSQLPANPLPAEKPNDYQQAMESSWGDDCLACGCSAGACPYWFGGVYGLVMTHDRSSNQHLSCDALTDNVLLSTNDAGSDWQGGAEIRFGRTFCNNQLGLEAVYWGLYDEGQLATLRDDDPRVTNQLISALSFSNLNIGPIQVENYWEGAALHALRRRFEAHNVEINLLTMPCSGCGCADCGFSSSWSLGVRFFRIDDDLDYSADDSNHVFGDGLVDEAHYTIDADNFLIGPQLGYRADYQWNQCLSFFADTKAGIYGNHMRHRQRVVDGLGQVAVINNGPDTFTPYDFVETKNGVSFLGEVRLGMGYQIHPNWRLTAGYRAVVISGVALAPEQVSADFSDLEQSRSIKSNRGSVIHGGFAGIEFRF